MHNFYKDKTILVTGGCGSIGSQIVKTLLAFNPKTIRVFDISEAGLFNLQQELKEYNNIRYLIGSIRDKERLRWAVKGADIIFHAAALKHVPLCEYNPFEAVQTNIIGTQNLVELAREEEVDRLIAISTDKAANPINTMGATKLLSEKLVFYGRLGNIVTKFCSVRFGNVLNSSGSVIPTFVKQIKNGGPVTVTSNEMTRFFMSISQAVGLVLKAGMITEGGEIFILKMKCLKIVDLAQAVIELVAPQYGYKKEDIKVEIIGVRPGEKLHELLVTEEEAHHIRELEDMYVLQQGLNVPHLAKEAPETVTPDNIDYISREAKPLSVEEIKTLLTSAGIF